MKGRPFAVAVAVTILAGTLAPPAASAAGTRACLVSNDRTGAGSRSLQKAVNAARPGDRLVVKGTCVGSTTIAKRLTLRGASDPAYGLPTLDGGGVGRVLDVAAGGFVALTDLILTHGATPDRLPGGALLVRGGTVVSVRRVTFRGNASTHGGGGIGVSHGGKVSISSSRVEGNTGGGIANSGALTLASSRVEGNTGGGIANRGTLTLTNSRVEGNTGGQGGGVANSGTMTLRGSTVKGNNGRQGGGIANYGTATITGSIVSGNSARYEGGGISNHSGGKLILADSTVADNTVDRLGGGIFNGLGPSTMTIVYSSVSGNVSGTSGGGIENRGAMTLRASVVDGNRGVNCGGGISSYVGTLTLRDSSVTMNTAVCGGGIANSSATMTIVSSTVSANGATVNGGGVLNAASMLDAPTTMTISGSTLRDNNAPNGGGVLNFGSLTFAGLPTAVGGNTATTGGGVHFEDPYGTGSVTDGCPVSLGGNVRYSPANTPTDYSGFTCHDQAVEHGTYAVALSPLSTYAAQTFTAGVTGTLVAVELGLDLPGSTHTTANVRIETMADGLPTGTVLATAAPVTLTTNGWVAFTFAAPARVTKGTQYAIVLVAPTPAWGISDLDPYAGGQAVMNGLAYPTDDFVFRTYVKVDFRTYVIVAGDTLSRIAERFGVTVDQILAANPSIADPNLIRVGQVINIPVS